MKCELPRFLGSPKWCLHTFFSSVNRMLDGFERIFLKISSILDPKPEWYQI